MPVAEVSVIPVGTETTSISNYVIAALEPLRKSNLKYELTSMGTNIEGNLSDILKIAQKMHEACFAKGALRVVTSIKIDDRKDKTLTMEGKVSSVLEKAKQNYRKGKPSKR